MEQKWDPAQYAEKGRFVALMAGSLVAELAPQPGEKILDKTLEATCGNVDERLCDNAFVQVSSA